ncbi:glycosyltransferase family 9 protein [Aliivibrio kagoshimensis]|uniref:glycosyltransferase family 9 protein n=1 Tax=Aliivibrio kagoshimensis TaxID=2910230 RepID=UPI003D1515DC
MALFSSAPKSICILRLSAIGDVCHAVSAVQAIQSHWPSTKITWIVGKIEAQLIHDLPNINVVVFDKKTGFAGMKHVWKQLGDQKFDALLHMQLALRASILTLGIKAKYKVGFNRKRAKEGQWLFTNKKITDTASAHVLDSFFSFAQFIGVPKSVPFWNIPLSADDNDFAINAFPTKGKTVVISPAASKDERNWSMEGYAQIADYALEQGCNVVLCGSPAPREIELGKRITQKMSGEVINLIGKTSLKQLTAVLKRADVVIAPDSGPAHIATTQGTPVIGLYAHSNPKRTGPYNDLDRVVSVYEHHAQKQHNKPIDQLAWSTRVKGEDLMSDITVERVKNSLSPIIHSQHSE